MSPRRVFAWTVTFQIALDIQGHMRTQIINRKVPNLPYSVFVVLQNDMEQ